MSGHAYRYIDRAPMPSRFPHGGERPAARRRLPAAAAQEWIRAPTGSEPWRDRARRAADRPVRDARRDLMGSYHSADSDLSNKDKSWIETLDDGTKILHGADGKLYIVSGDAGKSPASTTRRRREPTTSSTSSIARTPAPSRARSTRTRTSRRSRTTSFKRRRR